MIIQLFFCITPYNKGQWEISIQKIFYIPSEILLLNIAFSCLFYLFKRSQIEEIALNHMFAWVVRSVFLKINSQTSIKIKSQIF